MTGSVFFTANDDTLGRERRVIDAMPGGRVKRADAPIDLTDALGRRIRGRNRRQDGARIGQAQRSLGAFNLMKLPGDLTNDFADPFLTARLEASFMGDLITGEPWFTAQTKGCV